MVDERTGRAAATEKIEQFLSNETLAVKEMDDVHLTVYRKTDIGYVVIINHLHVPSTAAPVARRLITTTQLGRLRYERWFERSRGADGRMEVVNSYRTLDGDQLIRADEERRTVTSLDNDRVAEHAAAAGFVVDGDTAPGYWILTRP